MAGKRDHRDLDAWRLADQVRGEIALLVGRTGFEQHHWLRTQLLKSANSACANMAEGFSRYHPGEHARFLVISKASLSELCEHLEDARILHLVSAAEADRIGVLARRARGATTGLIRYLKSSAARRFKA